LVGTTKNLKTGEILHCVTLNHNSAVLLFQPAKNCQALTWIVSELTVWVAFTVKGLTKLWFSWTLIQLPVFIFSHLW